MSDEVPVWYQVRRVERADTPEETEHTPAPEHTQQIVLFTHNTQN